MFKPAADPSRSHFVCSFHGNAVSREADWSPTIGGGSSVAQDAIPQPMQVSRIIFMKRVQRRLEISATINDNVSLLNPGATSQAHCNDIADSGRGFN